MEKRQQLSFIIKLSLICLIVQPLALNAQNPDAKKQILNNMKCIFSLNETQQNTLNKFKLQV